ncbi:MAG: response regulator [Robiginitomaculum sp.]|nr:response regulator [Robiginitomaculum sp.]
MSADEVLASNLWPWPDPLLKRDQSGLVLFVNAAFLQLYGGRVEDWCGKPLAGWPEPVAAGAQRFETRIGVAPSENVYDWVESAMADGNALAIARNVTIFMAPAKQLAENVIPATPATPVEPPVASTPVPPAALAAPDISSEFQDTLNKRADEYAYDDNKTEQATPASTVVAPPVADQISMETTAQEPVALAQTPKPTLAHADEIKEETRMMERRALPIKDSTTVLGTNWRDEVIAKAVGGSAPEKETAQDEYDDEADGSAPKLGEGLQILLAEDNAINALLTRTLLEAEGAVVDTVEDGALALEAVNKKKYDLIFMDMRMPNMDGLEATRKIRALGSTIPIIALTANAFDDDRNACFDSGMNDFMTKPVSAEELSETVVNWTKSDEEKKLAS